MSHTVTVSLIVLIYTLFFPLVMELKLWLCFLLAQVTHGVQPPRGQWIAKIPTSIPALQGSCVVIPCIYTYPKPNSNAILNRWRGFWRKGNKIVSTNLPKWKMTNEYKKRTQFLGDLKLRNCTMLLDGVRNTDVGPFYFRIEIPQYKSFSYTKNPVSIDVTSDPQPPSLTLRVTDKVKAFCSVSHSCPSFPPKFSWSRSGTVTHRSKRLNEWKWETVSALTFKPLPADFKMPLNCTVQYRGGKQAMNSTRI
ncbi:sialic acid-binding Ig-like lectin 14 isoform X1 [Seriola dumerili]|uniref:sialic acid-binding Ig-like lectin 14 isoform X1 n=2 Tax=Seriola dumerili TaxID=41447 RepID=UPI000BBECDBB|nr:sialic acid-binding Ig-like lectin 14 isoform X1 [Seriola dumerili]